jgi:hypothetical protein
LGINRSDCLQVLAFFAPPVLIFEVMKIAHWLACFLLLGRIGLAAPRQHVVAFGKWTTVKWLVGQDERTALDLKMRSLLVDGRTKEFTTGLPYDVTDHTFVVQRIFRLNDTLPQETVPARWRWERGGWLLVNRVTGKMQQVPLPEFDPYYCAAAWFRDYSAYCGVSDDGREISATIVQLGRHKPLLKKLVDDASAETTGSECPAPVWQRAPSRVTFEPKREPKFTFTVPTRPVDLATEEDNAGEE